MLSCGSLPQVCREASRVHGVLDPAHGGAVAAAVLPCIARILIAGKRGDDAVMEPAVTLPFAPLQNDEFLRLVINSIRNDITGRNEPFQCLALNFIGSGERFDWRHRMPDTAIRTDWTSTDSCTPESHCSRGHICLLLQSAARRWPAC